MNKKKILAVTLATAVAFPTLTSVTPYNTVSNHVYAQTTQTTQVKVPFKDLSSSYVYLDIIKEMKEKGIIHGYEDGTFKPNVTLSRQHAAALIVRAMKVNGIELEKVRKFVQPKDLTTKNPYYQEIKLLMEAGLLDTDKNGNINPSKPLTRGDMAKILTKVFDLKVKADYIFDDVVGTGYEEYVKALYSNGVTTGFENHTYRVNEPLTRAHYAVFMYRAMNLDPNFNPQPIPPFKDLSSSYVYLDIIKEMKEKGIIHGYEDGTFRPNITLSRQQAAVLVARALKLNNLELKKTTKFVQPKDLTKANPYYDEIKMLMEAGLLEVDKLGYIHPEKPLTRGEMAKILTVAFDLKVKADYVFEDVKGTGYEEYVKALYSNGVTTGFEDYTFRVNESLTRAHYAAFMYRSMNLDPNFNPQPIPPSKEQQPNKPKEDTPKNPSTPTVKYSNLNSNQKDKIPKPAGYVAGEHERKNAEIVKQLEAKYGFGFGASFSIFESSYKYLPTSLEDQLRMDAKILGISYEEYVNIINWCIDTGKVYDGKTFAVYFDYNQGLITLSGIRNY